MGNEDKRDAFAFQVAKDIKEVVCFVYDYKFMSAFSA